MQKQRQLKFPKRFLWGVSSSAHQVEGGNHNQWSVWELGNAKTRAAKAEYDLDFLENWPEIKLAAKHPDNYVSGKAANHYNLYQQDFDLMEQMGVNSFRFSIEWSRIEPENGAWNVEAIEHYRRYIEELKNRNITPIVTLFHFTLPNWFSAINGFEKRSNTKYFLRFIKKVLSELGKDIKYVITINEPEIYVHESYFNANWPPETSSKLKGIRVLHNLIYTHKKAAKLIHGINRRYKVSVAKNSRFYYPGDDAWLSRLSARTFQYLQDDYVLKRVYKHCDFIGINHTSSSRVYGYRVHNPDDMVSDQGLDLQPANIQYVLERVYKKYHRPIIVTDNGLADENDNHRTWWLQNTLRGLKNALDNGVDLQGYIHKSLLDGFEWTYGKWPRFGLVAVDYENEKRTIRSSGQKYGQIITRIQKESL